MTLKRIHVNQHVIRGNQRSGKREAPLSVKTYNQNQRAHGVEILGPCTLVYSPDKPLACGARVWIETRAEVTVLGESDVDASLNVPA